MFDEKYILELNALLDKKRYIELRKIFAEENNVDIAEFIGQLPLQKAVLAFRMLPKEEAMHVFSELNVEIQQHIIGAMSDKEVSNIVDMLWVDDTVDMMEEMPATLVKKVLRNSSIENRKLINQFLKYAEDTAGSIMTAEFVDLRKSMTVGEAIASLRKTQHATEMIYTCFVIDDTRILEGVVTMKDLLLASDKQFVKDIMISDVKCVTTTTDQEETAKTMVKYGFISLPVVDAEHRLVGIVTVDDALDVIEEEDTEDFEKMAALSPSERPYMKTSAFEMAKNRLPWLMILLLSNMITGVVLGIYEPVYSMMPVLYTFMPMLTGTGGNAGSQSSTTIIRGMAVGEIRLKDTLAVLWKEVRVCLLVGLVLGAINFTRLIWMYPGQWVLSALVSLAMVASIFIGKTIGSMLPMVAKLCKVDPALVAAPLITTIVDVLALIIYYGAASVLMPLLMAAA